jgi:small-conductance mechanosensitive channel
MSELLAYFREFDADLRSISLHAARIAFILGVAAVLRTLALRLTRAFHALMARRRPGPDDERRIATLERVLRHVATVVIAVVAGMLLLAELGMSVAPVLATAGVAGVAVGFGAQSSAPTAAWSRR